MTPPSSHIGYPKLKFTIYRFKYVSKACLSLLASLSFIILSIFLTGICEADAKPKAVRLSIRICDKLNRRLIPNGAIELYSLPDSIKVKTIPSGRTSQNPEYSCSAMITPGKYLVGAYVRSDAEDRQFEPEWRVVEISAKQIDDFEIRLPEMFLGRRREKVLQEVTVTPSKIKFYHNGDTLIYNADAFVLAEGSMLDALIEQLPGVELLRNGVIKCNGRVVRELLLNGKNLFDGDNNLMLENLPAYTVKNIKVYDAMSDREKLAGMKLNESKYTMDVRLKRQYAMGWLLNADGGYGSHNRFLGKLFALWFSDNVSATAYAGANNLSDSKRPGKNDGAWSRGNMGDGVRSNVYGGIRYTADGFAEKWSLRGNVDVVRDKEDAQTRTWQQLYLDGGDRFLRRWSGRTDRNLKISADQMMTLRFGQRAVLKGNLILSHTRRKTESSTLEATLDDDIPGLTSGMLESLYNSGEALRQHLVNRRQEAGKNDRESTYGKMSVWSDIKLKDTGFKRMMYAHLYGTFTESKGNSFNRMGIDWFGMPQQENQRYDRFINLRPDRDINYNAAVRFDQLLSKKFGDNVNLWYEFDHKEETRTSELYNLDRMEGYNPENPGFGHLPSTEEYRMTFDPLQSYRSRLSTDRHVIRPEYVKVGSSSRKFHLLPVFINIPLTVLNRHLDYNGRGVSRTIRRRDVMAGFHSTAHITFPEVWTRIELIFSSTPMEAPMMSLLDVVDDTDPLNIHLGNPSLKNSRNNNLSVNMLYRMKKRRLLNRFFYSFNDTHNAIGQGYFYNQQTGVRFYRPYNVNGNRNMSGGYEASLNLGKNRQISLSSTTEAYHTRSMDLSGTFTGNEIDLDIPPPLRKVVTSGLSENIKGSIDLKTYRFTANAELKALRYSSPDPGFSGFTSWTGKYGGSALLNLPRNWSLSTDINLYTRRGFGDKRLNTTDLVWNARVSKSILKGRVVLVADGYDLLHQLSNIAYTINAQARTEIVSNVIPAYILFHIQWRWNKQPKR